MSKNGLELATFPGIILPLREVLSQIVFREKGFEIINKIGGKMCEYKSDRQKCNLVCSRCKLAGKDVREIDRMLENEIGYFQKMQVRRSNIEVPRTWFNVQGCSDLSRKWGYSFYWQEPNQSPLHRATLSMMQHEGQWSFLLDWPPHLLRRIR